MNKIIKRKLTRCVILLAAIIAVMFASGITRSFIQAETSVLKIEKNAGYFSGDTDMGTVEVTRVSLNAMLDAVNFFLTALTWLLVILFVYNGSIAVYITFNAKEKKHEKN
jgi:hypothetical protein